VTSPVRLDVWSDVLCPWCYVADVRIDALAAALGDTAVVQWHTYLLQPEPRVKALDSFRRYTQRWFAPGGPAELEPAAEFRPWGEERPPTHSMPAAVAVHAVARLDAAAAPRLHRALMHAYFAEHRDVSDRDVIFDVCAASGVDRAALEAMLRAHGAELREAALTEHDAALEHGITAVPSVLVNDALVIPGAHDVATYRRIVERVLARTG
jgi:predicted DsbA family dithiol-disulfide isomerase